ncbi:hypothetical protein E2C01_089350 [Portunus trituberculatus]|uniref:Uncharacterized protein n=1 Tax=Portunus trituberculatus TaxID=210409 RepID=A0A5B7JPC3_PORTR|nr:hypothetical protein [Portunus trituberculatus]
MYVVCIFLSSSFRFETLREREADNNVPVPEYTHSALTDTHTHSDSTHAICRRES